MGKKSRRRPRQEKKYTIDDLDDDTAKPTPAPDDLEIYRRCNSQHEGDHDKMIASFAALPERQKQAYAMMAKEKRVLFDRRVAFCAKSGPDLVGELFLEVTPFVGVIGSLKLPGVEVRVVGLNQTIWEASHHDKDVLVYEVVDDGETRPKELISLRELRARACGDARAARKAARRSYEFVSAGGFDPSTGARFHNGRVISNAEQAFLSDAMSAVVNETGTFDKDALREYFDFVVFPRHRFEGMHGALRAVYKWPRVRPYWRRIRRRVCENCASQVDLSEPRYLVCSGCGDARYCSEACQRAHWANHQKKCPAGLGESTFEQMMLAAFGNDAQRAALRPPG